MKNKILNIIIVLFIAVSLIISWAIISNYFTKVSTFEPVYIRLKGIDYNMIKDIKALGYTPEGKKSDFRFNDSLKAFYSYYGFLGSIRINIPIILIDSLKSINISTGRETFNYNKTDIDTAWKPKLESKENIEIKSPLSLKTKETKIRILASIRYWFVFKIALYILLAVTTSLFVIKGIKKVFKKKS